MLPLANISGDPSNDYFGEGLAEEITTALGKTGLRVVGRGSARALVARGFDARAVARELGVGTVLQGSVQRAGDRLRITVSLTSAADGALLWSERYDRDSRDIFAVQDDIARGVASELRVALSSGGARLVRNETSDPEAHALYLQGLYLWNRRTAASLRRAITFFEQAIARDSSYLRPHAGIALAYVVLPVYEDIPTDDMLAKARDAAQRVLARDSTLAEAHAVIGHADTYQWRFAQAEQALARAIHLDPILTTARQWRALLLSARGELAEGLERRPRAPATNTIVRLSCRMSSRAYVLRDRRHGQAGKTLELLLVQCDHRAVDG